MAPKTVSLAYAGRKLTGPPEGYGKKKEFQVKLWISGIPPPEDWDASEVGSVATLTEIERSREDLYRSLRDSTDGFGVPPPSLRPGSKAPEPGPGPPRLAVPPSQLQQPAQPLATPTGMPGIRGGTERTNAAATGPARHPLTSPGSAAITHALGAVMAAAGSGSGGGSSIPWGRAASTSPRLELQPPTASGSVAGLPPPLPLLPAGSVLTSFPGTRPAAAAVVAAAAAAANVSRTAITTTDTAMQPLDMGLARSGADDEDVADADAGLAAVILMARVEATLPQGAGAEEKLRAALMLAVEEHLRLQDSFRSELAAVRAIAAEAKAEAQSRAADVQEMVRRAVQAEEDLGRARAEALAHKRQAQMLQAELDEGREARDEQMLRTQSELAEAVSQLKEQSARAARAIEESAAEVAAARSAAAALQREVAVLRRHSEQDKLRLEAMSASLQAGLEEQRREAAALRLERDRAAVALQAEAAARKAAEESERAALLLAAKQTDTQEAIHAKAAVAQATRQRVAAAAQRAALVRAADPSAAVVGAAAEIPSPASGPVRAAAGAVDGLRAGHARAARGRQQQQPTAAVLPVRGKMGGDRPAGQAGGGGGVAEAAVPGPAAAAAVAAARADGHRALSRSLAAERQQLGELVQMQRRAAAAAELADARVAEAALAAAPEHLRLLGLAFRVYIVGGGAGGEPEAAGLPARGRGGGPAPGSAPAAVLAGRLSSSGYRVYVDPLTLQRPTPQLHEVPSAPLVARAAVVVVLAEAGLLRRPLARDEIYSAARHGCPLLVLSPSDLTPDHLTGGEEPPLPGGDSAALELNLALDALRKAWPSRLTLAPDSAAAAAAVAVRLGLPDPSLALLPPDALRVLAVSRTGTMPDLAFLNAPPPPLSPGGGGAGALSGTGAAAAGLPGLQHLKLCFGSSGATDGKGGGGGAAALLVELLCSVLRGNSTLTALTLRGCPAAAARIITQTALDSPVGRVAAIAISCRVPVAQLAGRPVGGRKPPQVVEIGAAAGGGGGAEVAFTDEDAEVVAAALCARVAAEGGEAPPPPLLAVTFPPSCNLRLGRAAVGALTGALAGLSGLQFVNGVPLQVAATAAAGGDSGGAGGDGGVLDLSGSRCGPLVLALLAGRLKSALASLPALNLTGCEVGLVGASCLAAEAGGTAGRPTASGGAAARWRGLTAVQTACLADNGLGPEGIDVLLSVMVGSGNSSAALHAARGPSGSGSSCTILDVSLNNLADAGCKALSRWLPTLGPSLRVLALSHNGIGTDGARALAGALPACEGLRELLLGGNQLGDQAARELRAALIRLERLQVLQLHDNPRISSDGVAALAEAVVALTALRELDLSRSYAGDEGARQLAKALGTHPTLASVSLEGCKIRAEGAAHLAAALGLAPSAGPHPPPRLTQLLLARNQLGDRGAAALAAALGRNSCLTHLDLRANGVGVAGCRSLGGALRERNCTLRRLAVAGNELEEQALQALEDLAAGPRSIPARPHAPPPSLSLARAGAETSAAAGTPPGRTGPSQQPSSRGPPQQRHTSAAAATAAASPSVAAADTSVSIANTSGARSASPATVSGGGVSNSISSTRQLLLPQTRPATVPPARPELHWQEQQQQPPQLGLGSEQTEARLLSATEALAAAEVALAGAGLSSGIDGDGAAGVWGNDAEDLEALLSRYRSQPAGHGATTSSPGAGATCGSVRGSPGGRLLDLGYTGM